MQKKAARRGQRALAFLLCLLMVATLLPVMGASAAEGVQPGGGNTETNPVLTKNLYLVSDGTYTIRLEAYATGTTTTVTEKSGKPLDIVLVLDQSGSMSDSEYVEPLKTAVTAFVKSISDNAKEYNVDHRIALVGYASRYDSNSRWVNTGLFINGSLYNYQKQGSSTETSRLTEQNYQDALVSVNGNDGNVANSITTAISKINGKGATYTNYGMEMANGVFQYNPIEEGSDRQRIVVVFTDGEPGKSGYDQDVANAALSEAYKTKNTYGATVYTVGLYSEASTNVTTFMNYLSSNYPKAQSMDNNGVTPVIEYLSVPAAQINNYGTYYYFNNGKYERVYYCGGDWGYAHAPGWYPQEHEFRYHPGDPIDPSTTQFYVQQTTTPAVATKYYMTTSSSGELDRIFHNISEDIQHPSTDITLNENSVLRDVITSGFDLPDNFTTGAVSVSTQAGSTDSAGRITWGSTTANPAGITVTANADLKSIAVTGFNYSDKYITQGHDGEKLIVKISGLLPNTSSDKLYSNEEISGIYQTAVTSETPFLFPMPYTSVGLENRVVDFGMTVNIADNVLNTNAATHEYGTFSRNGNNTYTYNLNSVKGDNGNYTFGFTGVDSSLYFANGAWTKVNVIPANNVYYDDTFLSGGDTGISSFNDGKYGYDANVPATTDTTSVSSGETTFTFKGRRIDVYCTTESASGAVIGQLKAADGTVVATKLMRNEYESGALYNVPTLSFETPDANATYTLTITTNDQSNYKLDGVRVYHPADETNETVQNAYANDDEQNAVFTQVRKILLTANSFGEGPYSGVAISGVVYTDATREGGQTHDTNNVAETYKDLGPKNEVYLANGNGIAFKIPNYNGQKVMIGLSAPETAASGTVTATKDSDAQTIEIKSNVDMYYEVTPTSDGYVFIKNTSDALIAVTNVKVSGTAADAESLCVDADLLSYVADFDTLAVVQPEPEPTPDPEPEVSNNTISAIIHAIWSSVKTSIDRLFGRL